MELASPSAGIANLLPTAQICGVKIPLPDRSFFKLFDFFIGQDRKEHFQVRPRIVGHGSS
jgi:hypothetical protein